MDHTYLFGDMLEMLSYGHICLPEKEIAALGQLPREEFHGSRELKRLSCLETLKLTAESLEKWLPAGTEENRFGIPFINVSRLIMDAVTTMGRGLVTLHMLGEDLSQAPMLIEKLLDIASFHFMKSYEGVKASAGVNPTACTRLFANQLRWQNLILRLYRTKERLEKPYIPAAAGKKEGQEFQISGEAAHGSLQAETPLRPLPASRETEAADADISASEQPDRILPETGSETTATGSAAEVLSPETPEEESSAAEPAVRRSGTDRMIEEIRRDWPDDGIPVVSDGLIERMTASIRQRRMKAPPPVDGSPDAEKMCPIPMKLFVPAEPFGTETF